MKRKRIFQIFLVVLTLALCLCAPAFAAGGDVAGAVEQTWTDASSQIKTVVDNVVVPGSEHGAGHRLLRQARHGVL